jgi:hypothetical protein
MRQRHSFIECPRRLAQPRPIGISAGGVKAQVVLGASPRLKATFGAGVEVTGVEVSRGLNPRFGVGGRVRPDNLSVGITLFGRPRSEPAVLKLAYANEQATHHHAPPKTTPRGLLRGLQIVG